MESSPSQRPTLLPLLLGLPSHFLPPSVRWSVQGGPHAIISMATGATAQRPNVPLTTGAVFVEDLMEPLPVPPEVLELNVFLDTSTIFNVIPPCISSPIQIWPLASLLRGHPDQNLVHFLLQGFISGFDIGYEGPQTSTQPRNLLSARREVLGVTEAIQTELQRGHSAGPFNSPPFPCFHCSPLGAVEKSNSSFRLILDLSSPRGQSINEGISKEKFSVTYSRFDDAVDIVRPWSFLFHGKIGC